MRTVLLTLLIAIILPLPAQTGDFGRAQWIGHMTHQQARLPEGRNFTGAKLKEPAVKAAWQAVDTLSDRSIILRKDLRLRGSVRQATVHIVGLGFYELTLNGLKVGDAEFAPLWSDYDKTVFYNTYDVTPYLSPLTPHLSLRVLLGNGFYNEQGKRYAKMKIAFGPPTLLFRLHIDYQDGSAEDVVSDLTWQWALSPITFNSIYGGEDYDARKEASPSPSQGADAWHPVVVQEAPKGVLRKQIAQPVKIMERYPVKDTVLHIPSPGREQGGGILVLDMGQNLAGYPEITVEGKAGQRLKLIPGETLTGEGLVNQKQTGRPHYYTYTLNGKDKPWHPRFSYYGYRYLQVEGDIEVLRKVESCFVYNAAQKTATFECSNPLFNDAYRLIDRAIRSNWQAVWTDCPHREKLGWLEQDWLNGRGLMDNYDCRSMIEQTMQNIADAQQPNGALPEIAPNLCVFEGSWAPPFLESPEWGGAFLALPMNYYAFYGDDQLIRRHYDGMKRYVDYLTSCASGYILDQGLGDWYDYGPGRAGFAQNTTVPFVASAHLYQWTKHLYLMAGIIGKDADEAAYRLRADSIRAAINERFYDARRHQYDKGSQCANAIALEMQLVPPSDRDAVYASLVADIHAHGDRLTTGDVGTHYLFNVLAHSDSRQHRELLYTMLNHYEVPGYGYQIKLGHTTLTEQWNPEHGASMNHFMMGHLNNLLISTLLGISYSHEMTCIAPTPVGDLSWCRGSMNTPKGRVSCQWHVKGDTFVLDVEMPADQWAYVTMPYSGREEHARPGRNTFTEQVMTTNR